MSKSIQNMNDELEDYGLNNGIDYRIIIEFMRVMKKPNIYIWCNKEQIPKYLDIFAKGYGCSFDILIWQKTNATPLFCNKYLTDKEYCLYFRKGGYCQPQNYEDAKTIFNLPINIKDKDKFLHPTCKPLNIIETLIKNSSKEGDIILDTFLGSGTTAVACKNTNRNFIGFEINKKWYDIANDRLNNIDANGQYSLFTN